MSNAKASRPPIAKRNVRLDTLGDWLTRPDTLAAVVGPMPVERIFISSTSGTLDPYRVAAAPTGGTQCRLAKVCREGQQGRDPATDTRN
jgi:hypothetical protein